MSDIIKSPMKPIATPRTKGSGSPEVNGEPGLQKRTKSSNGVDEIVRDGSVKAKYTNPILSPMKPIKK